MPWPMIVGQKEDMPSLSMAQVRVPLTLQYSPPCSSVDGRERLLAPLWSLGAKHHVPVALVIVEYPPQHPRALVVAGETGQGDQETGRQVPWPCHHTVDIVSGVCKHAQGPLKLPQGIPDALQGGQLPICFGHIASQRLQLQYPVRWPQGQQAVLCWGGQHQHKQANINWSQLHSLPL